MKLESINDLKYLISNLFEIDFDDYAMEVNSSLPLALQELYKIDDAFAKSNCKYETIRFFRNMDRLTHYLDLKVNEDQFVFATENQGNWYAKTSLNDDKVYIYDHEELQDGAALEQNIESFLITFALIELSNNFNYFFGLFENDVNEVKKQFEKSEELWMNKKYLLRDTSFYLIDYEVLFDEANMTIASNNQEKMNYYRSKLSTYNFH